MNVVVIHTPDGTTWSWGGVSLFGRHVTGDDTISDGIYLTEYRNIEPFGVVFRDARASLFSPCMFPVIILPGQQLEVCRIDGGEFVPIGVLRCDAVPDPCLTVKAV